MNNEKKQDDTDLIIKRGRGRPKKEKPTISDVMKKSRGRPTDPELPMRNFQISRKWIESPDNLSSEEKEAQLMADFKNGYISHDIIKDAKAKINKAIEDGNAGIGRTVENFDFVRDVLHSK